MRVRDTQGSGAVRVRMVLWDLATPLLGLASGFVAATVFEPLRYGNAVWWTVVAMFIAKRRGAHLRKWIRLAVFGFAVGYAFAYYGHEGPAPFPEHVWRFLGLGLCSALAAVPSGGLIHLWIEMQSRRRRKRRTR